MDMEKIYLTVSEISNLLNISRQAIHKWIQLKKIKAYRAGRNWRIKPEDLELFITCNLDKKNDK